MSKNHAKQPFLRKPSWIKSLVPSSDEFKRIKQSLKERKIHTVCEEAMCPNLGECWKMGTATMMILGDTCTRNCRFCNVKTGNPNGFVDESEIDGALEMIELMNLSYLVLTSVDRDDLSDYGAGHFARLVEEINNHFPKVKTEVLIPDFNNDHSAMRRLGASNPFVIAHNVETVRSLTGKVRDAKASYEKSLSCLSFYKRDFPNIVTKTSLMVGMGETFEELKEATREIKESGVDIITYGQYLQPSRKHYPVHKYYTPQEFEELKTFAQDCGFKFVCSGPMVRSSYRAADYLEFLEKQSGE